MDAASKLNIERLKTHEMVLTRILAETKMDREAAELVAGVHPEFDAPEDPDDDILGMEAESPTSVTQFAARHNSKSRTIQTEEDLEDEVAEVHNPIGDKPPRKESQLKRYIRTGKWY